MDYITISGGSGGGFDIQDITSNWIYILGAVLGMFVLMAGFISWQSR